MGHGQQGTHKYQAEWAVLDQILVSGELLEEIMACTVQLQMHISLMQTFYLLKMRQV